jgi:putative ABC transport system permease protein
VKLLRRLLLRLSNSATRRRAGERLQEEMAQHLALQTEENCRAGMSFTEARRQAALKLGATQAIREYHHAEQTLPLFENILLDLRFALRTFRKSPGFACIAIATVALGIGATTAIFSVVDATLLHPLPYPNPEELVRVEADLPGVGSQDVGMSIPELMDLQHSGIFQYVSIHSFGSVNLTGTAQPARIIFRPVTPNYFAVLGVKPQLGRTFDPNDTTPGFNLEAVISDGLWKRSFGSDQQILGKSLRLDNDVYHIIGVMPPGFRDQGRTLEERNTEVWLGTGFADSPAPVPMRSSRLTLSTFARLKPGLTIAAAQSQLDALVASLKAKYPADYPAQGEWTLRLLPLSEFLVGNIRQSLILLLGAVALVLLIGCANVANLLLARASARGREIAVRQALGADRTRILGQLLTESLLLSLLGGIAGLAVLYSARSLLLQLIPQTFPRLNDISINWTVLTVALVASVLAGLLFGLAPAWLTSRLDLTGTLRREGLSSNGSPERTRTRRILVIGELALSLMLMIAAGLLLRSFWDLFQVQLGFNPARVMTVQTWLPVPNDPKTDIYRTATQEAVLLREMLRRTRTLPGVEQVAVGNLASLPLWHNRLDVNFAPLIRESTSESREPSARQSPVIDMAAVSPEYFSLLGMTLQRGRLFNDQDLENTPPVALINEAAAQAYWPNQNPIGRRFKLGSPAKRSITIIGVMANARTESLADSPLPLIYFSVYQHRANDIVIFLRGQVDPATIPQQVREQVQAIDAELPVFRAQTLDDIVAGSLSARKFSMEIVALFAATALLLAALGIYGTISYLVSEQTREFGIRIALGAQRERILQSVLRQGLGLALRGAAIGLAGAFIVSHMMAGLLFGVRPTDLLTFLIVPSLLIAVALAACYIPARRAMRVDPLTALRYE